MSRQTEAKVSAPEMPLALATVGTTTQALDIRSVADALVKSKFFADARDASQAIVKILMGRELGFAPMASMTGINVIQGKPALGANLIAAKIQTSGLFRYRVVQLDNKGCKLDIYERVDAHPETPMWLAGQGPDAGMKKVPAWQWEKVGESSFTHEDALTAGLAFKANYKTSPRNMFFARAISNAAKWYCSGLFGGNPVYVPEELGANVDSEGRVLGTPTSLPGRGESTTVALDAMERVLDHAAAQVQAAPAPSVIDGAGRVIDVGTEEILNDSLSPDTVLMNHIMPVVATLDKLGLWRVKRGITRAIFGEFAEDEAHLAMLAEQSPEMWRAGLERLGLMEQE